MIPRFYCSIPLAPGATVELPPQVAHHAERVLRLDVGDELTLFNGEGGEYPARLVSLGKRPRALLGAWCDIERETPLAITLAQALPSGDKMDWVIQKATELGVRRIVPVQSQRSVLRLSGERAVKRLAHWRQVAVAACEQCGRNRVPQVDEIQSLPQFLAATQDTQATRLILSLRGQEKLSAVPQPQGNIILLIGPEGDFEEGEEQAALASGFHPAALGPRILRTETAGLAAIATLQARLGDF